MLYAWKIKSYAYLVKIERYELEPVEGSEKVIVEESYRTAVAIYLTTGEVAA
ncbi:CD1375 family protein [Alkaliphilus sp. B6464]|uniref:CD1375 family protein n=1 Tax=Alkaliphilus sp. B6464 TaxID=2731219 RepID=UPI001BAC352E|nr:CD1375 family protein [Alkaliphilus sp. B6464]QUH21408.1 hypothetical protein HYG84_16970 [Alkaliphilus sp. B6464]